MWPLLFCSLFVFETLFRPELESFHCFALIEQYWTGLYKTGLLGLLIEKQPQVGFVDKIHLPLLRQ